MASDTACFDLFRMDPLRIFHTLRCHGPSGCNPVGTYPLSDVMAEDPEIPANELLAPRPGRLCVVSGRIVLGPSYQIDAEIEPSRGNDIAALGQMRTGCFVVRVSQHLMQMNSHLRRDLLGMCQRSTVDLPKGDECLRAS